MSLFDLLFIVLFLTALATLITAAWFTLRTEFGRVRRILFRLLIVAAGYMAIVVAVSLMLPRRVLKISESECFDDLCVSVAGFRRATEGVRITYNVDLRLFSRARRVAQRENNLAVYLTDARGHRYHPADDNSSDSFNVLLQPQESVVVRRSFLVPSDAAEVSAVITHEGGFPIGWFIIGYDTWFRKPAISRLS